MIEEAVTDERLLLAARTDPEAFTRFYRRHAPVLLGYLVRRTGERRELGRGEALGWTTDGRAIVSGACGDDGHYLVTPDGEREPWAGPKDRLEPSLTPMDLGG